MKTPSVLYIVNAVFAFFFWVWSLFQLLFLRKELQVAILRFDEGRKKTDALTDDVATNGDTKTETGIKTETVIKTDKKMTAGVGYAEVQSETRTSNCSLIPPLMARASNSTCPTSTPMPTSTKTLDRFKGFDACDECEEKATQPSMESKPVLLDLVEEKATTILEDEMLAKVLELKRNSIVLRTAERSMDKARYYLNRDPLWTQCMVVVTFVVHVLNCLLYTAVEFSKMSLYTLHAFSFFANHLLLSALTLRFWQLHLDYANGISAFNDELSAILFWSNASKKHPSTKCCGNSRKLFGIHYVVYLLVNVLFLLDVIAFSVIFYASFVLQFAEIIAIIWVFNAQITDDVWDIKHECYLWAMVSFSTLALNFFCCAPASLRFGLPMLRFGLTMLNTTLASFGWVYISVIFVRHRRRLRLSATQKPNRMKLRRQQFSGWRKNGVTALYDCGSSFRFLCCRKSKLDSMAYNLPTATLRLRATVTMMQLLKCKNKTAMHSFVLYLATVGKVSDFVLWTTLRRMAQVIVANKFFIDSKSKGIVGTYALPPISQKRRRQPRTAGRKQIADIEGGLLKAKDLSEDFATIHPCEVSPETTAIHERNPSPPLPTAHLRVSSLQSDIGHHKSLSPLSAPSHSRKCSPSTGPMSAASHSRVKTLSRATVPLSASHYRTISPPSASSIIPLKDSHSPSSSMVYVLKRKNVGGATEYTALKNSHSPSSSVSTVSYVKMSRSGSLKDTHSPSTSVSGLKQVLKQVSTASASPDCDTLFKMATKHQLTDVAEDVEEKACEKETPLSILTASLVSKSWSKSSKLDLLSCLPLPLPVAGDNDSGTMRKRKPITLKITSVTDALASVKKLEEAECCKEVDCTKALFCCYCAWIASRLVNVKLPSDVVTDVSEYMSTIEDIVNASQSESLSRIPSSATLPLPHSRSRSWQKPESLENMMQHIDAVFQALDTKLTQVHFGAFKQTPLFDMLLDTVDLTKCVGSEANDDDTSEVAI